jgi:hypothetical protein
MAGIYGTLKHERDGVMTYYMPEEGWRFVWEGREEGLGGTYIDVHKGDDEIAFATICTAQNGYQIGFDEDLFRAEIEEWYEHNADDFRSERH